MKKYRRKAFMSVLMGIIIAFCYEVGGRIGAEGAERFGNTEILVRFLMKMLIGSVLIFLSWTLLPKLYEKCKEKLWFKKVLDFLQRIEKFSLPFWARMIVLLLMWLPVFLSIFPGAFAYDAPTEWEQFVSGQITTHHPVLHTLLIGICLEGGKLLFSSYNAGIAMYTIFQMLAMSAIFSYTISFMKRYHIPVLMRGFAFLFYGLSPVIHLFVVSSTKDTLFTGVFLLFILSLIDFGCRREEFFAKRHRQVFFVLSALGTMLLRNNGLYVVLVTLAVMLILGKKSRKKLLILFAVVGVLYGIVTGPVYKALQVEKGGVQEMFSVPLQQMARTYMYNYSELEQEDIALLEALIPKEDLNNYLPTLADNVKRNFRQDVFAENKGAYLKLWIKWGLKYPMTYISSFLINTSDFWYPLAVVDGYNPGGESTDYFRYSVGYPGERVEMLEGVHELYRALSEDRSASEAPFIFLLISPGWYLLVTLYFCATYYCERKKEFLLPSLAILVSEITVLLGPIAQVRYVLILYFAFPVLFSMFLHKTAYGDKRIEA